MTIVVGHLWAVCYFVLHPYFSRKGRQDAIYHQRQAILRNSSSPVGTAWALLRMTWRWRKSSKSPHRILPFLGCLLVVTCGFTAATILSSWIARGSEVLLNGTNCGRPLHDGDAERDETLGDSFFYVWRAGPSGTPLAGCVQRCLRRDPYVLYEWFAGGTLQLRRLAHEKFGVGPWSHCNDDSLPLLNSAASPRRFIRRR